jgi:hypothetical protein
MAIDESRMTPADIEYARRFLVGMATHQGQVSAINAAARESKPAKPRGKPNALEADFARHCLEACYYEADSFFLARHVCYTPDFTIYLPGDKLSFVEIKSDTKNPTVKSRYQASLTKLKVCADRWPNLKWYIARRDKGGAWNLYPVTSAGISGEAEIVPWMR